MGEEFKALVGQLKEFDSYSEETHTVGHVRIYATSERGTIWSHGIFREKGMFSICSNFQGGCSQSATAKRGLSVQLLDEWFEELEKSHKITCIALKRPEPMF